MSTPHTPTPWTFDGRYIHGPAGKRFLATAGDEEGQANARLIVQAVNSHEAMAEALRIADEALARLLSTDRFDRKDSLGAIARAQYARELIAKLSGEQARKEGASR